MRKVLALVSIFAAFVLPLSVANTAQAKQETTHYKSEAVLDVKAKANPTLTKRGGTTFNSAYGWNWDGLVEVYDATGNPVWDVPGAVAKWHKAGINVVITTNRANAEIVVEQGDANAFCNSTNIIIGCGGSDIDANNEPYQGKAVMSQDWADWPYTETQRGGTVHELGHTLGFGHPAGLTNADSVMAVPIPTSGATEVLTPYDKSGVRYLY